MATITSLALGMAVCHDPACTAEVPPAEVQVEGVIENVNVPQSRLLLYINVVTQPDGESVRISNPQPKLVTIGKDTRVFILGGALTQASLSAVKPGALVQITGKDSGAGRHLQAREIGIWDPALALDARGSHPTSSAAAGGPARHDPRTLDASHPLKIWMGGDSLSLIPGGMLANIVNSAGVVTCKVDSMNSTGLANPAVRDWRWRFRTVVDRWDPDVVVVMMGGSDLQSMIQGSKTLSFASRDWQAEYLRRVEESMDTLLQGNRMVLWVGMPIMRDTDGARRNPGMLLLNRLFQQAAASRPGVTYVDSWKLFSTPSGQYAESLPGAPRLRASDGVHFSYDGGDRLAHQLFKIIDARWNVSRYFKPGERNNRPASPPQNPPPIVPLVIEAKLLKVSPTPRPADIAPYRSALVIDDYQVERVVEGTYQQGDILVARWGILDAAVVASNRRAGEIYRLALESFADHPGLESQPRYPDTEDTGDLFQEVETIETPNAAGYDTTIIPGPGEVRMDGVIAEVNAADGNFLLSVTAKTPPEARPTAVAPTQHKKVLIEQITPIIQVGDPPQRLSLGNLRRGMRVGVVGKDLGDGQSLRAMAVELAP